MSEVKLMLESAITVATATLQNLRALEPELARAADLIAGALRSGRELLVCGNGGSAADAADFATEFACRFVADRRPYPARNLCADGSLTSAIGNDYGFEETFARQVWAFGQPGDVLVAISTSGASGNIRRALEAAASHGLSSIAVLGRDGGAARGLATVDLVVPGEATARIQEAHKFLLHVLCEIVETRLPRA